MQGQVAADRIEQERRHLRQEVIDELDQEFPLINVVANFENSPKPVRYVGAFVIRRVVGAHDVDALEDLAHPPSQLSGGELALTAQSHQPPAHLWYEEALHQHD